MQTTCSGRHDKMTSCLTLPVFCSTLAKGKLMTPYPFEIIDFHVHPYLNPSQSLCMYEHTVPDTASEMDQAVTGFGVNQYCGSVLNKDWSHSLNELNSDALELRSLLGNRYIPGFHIHPCDPEGSIRWLQYMQSQGYRLIGELVPYMHDWSQISWQSCNARLDDILSSGNGSPLVFSFHTMWDWNLDDLIAAHPEVTFVAAHPGERESVEKHIYRMKKYDNVCLDLSGTGIFRNGCIRHLVDQVGAERILFGTDYPICNHQMYIGAVLGEHLDDRTLSLIFSGNARRILNLHNC